MSVVSLPQKGQRSSNKKYVYAEGEYWEIQHDKATGVMKAIGLKSGKVKIAAAN